MLFSENLESYQFVLRTSDEKFTNGYQNCEKYKSWISYFIGWFVDCGITAVCISTRFLETNFRCNLSIDVLMVLVDYRLHLKNIIWKGKPLMLIFKPIKQWMRWGRWQNNAWLCKDFKKQLWKLNKNRAEKKNKWTMILAKILFYFTKGSFSSVDISLKSTKGWTLHVKDNNNKIIVILIL